VSETDNLIWSDQALADKLCWYCRGNFFRLFNNYAGRDPHPLLVTQALTDATTLNPVQDPDMSGTGNTLIVKLVNVGHEAGVGLFVRIFTCHSASFINAFERQLIETGKVREMPDELARSFAPLIAETLYAARSLWREY